MSPLVGITLISMLPGAVATEPIKAENTMHPAFAPLDAQGQPAAATHQPIVAEPTCGACHDVPFIKVHDNHAGTGATCIQCHVRSGPLSIERLDKNGLLGRDVVQITRPGAAECGRCHGVIQGADGPVTFPADFQASPAGSGHTYALSWGEGAVVSPQTMSSSFLSLAGKTQLNTPWDVHAAKLVDCADCHRAGNDPARLSTKLVSLNYVKDDPRRPSIAEFLRRPDHRLQAPDCRTCHEPLAIHDFLPYRQRHMQVLACQACHIPEARAAVGEMIDATVVTASGAPVVIYRNVQPQPNESLNTALIRSFVPPLLTQNNMGRAARLGPMNVVTRWQWVSGSDHEVVPLELLTQAFVAGDRYLPEILPVFDANHDGDVSALELRLDNPQKVGLIAARLSALGVKAPEVEGTLELHPFEHGVGARERAVRDCTSCHAEGSRVSAALDLSPYVPAQALPKPRDRDVGRLTGTVGPNGAGGLILTGSETVGDLHVLGRSRHATTNTLGFWIVMVTVLGCLAHALIRWVFRRRAAAGVLMVATKRALLFGLYERVWHWIMAASVMLLVATGLQIHTAGPEIGRNLAIVVDLHNSFAVILTINAFLAFFYHVSTAAIRQFFPEPRGLVASIMAHLDYYGRGIFFGAPHPNPDRKLNPLQQLTYLALLTVLFPLQIGTGMLIWAVGLSPSLADALGGLAVVAPLHNLGAWLLLAFFVLHVYLTTTGPTLAAHVKAMITGYAEIEPQAPRFAKGERP
jgi:thiosulfate reductase cytochrome b subunit